MSWRAMFRPGMRAYFVPLVAGLALEISIFLPWVVVGSESLSGFPDTAALWVAGLGAVSVVLAVLSLITRKNSRHPLLIVGLAALGIMSLSWRIMPGTVSGRALIREQAVAIVEDRAPGDPPEAVAGSGIYLGLAASSVIVGFGLTIVIRRASTPYAVVDPNDDV
jgi:hypothetical protein